MAQYSLFVLKVPLNIDQPINLQFKPGPLKVFQRWTFEDGLLVREFLHVRYRLCHSPSSVKARQGCFIFFIAVSSASTSMFVVWTSGLIYWS